MTISIASFTKGNAPGAASSLIINPSNALTWVLNRWYVIDVMADQAAPTSPTPTITSCTQIATVISPNNIQRQTTFCFLGDGSTSSLTIDFGGSSQNRIVYVISEWQGVNTSSGTNGITSAVRAANIVTATGSSTTIGVTLPNAFLDAVNNVTYLSGEDQGWETQTPKAGFTKIIEDTSSWHTTQIFLVGQDLTPNMTSASSDNWLGIGFEVIAAASGSGALPTLKQKGWVGGGFNSDPSINEYQSKIFRAQSGIIPASRPARPRIFSSIDIQSDLDIRDNSLYIDKQFKPQVGTTQVAVPIIGKSIVNSYPTEDTYDYANTVVMTGPSPGIGVINPVARTIASQYPITDSYNDHVYNQTYFIPRQGIVPATALGPVTKVFLANGYIALDIQISNDQFPKMYGSLMSRQHGGIIPTPPPPGIVVKGGFVGVSVRVGGS